MHAGRSVSAAARVTSGTLLSAAAVLLLPACGGPTAAPMPLPRFPAARTRSLYPTPLDVEADRFVIHVALDPASHRLVGRTRLTLRATTDPLPDGRVAVVLALNDHLVISRATAPGLVSHAQIAPRSRPEPPETAPAEHVFVLRKALPRFDIQIEYGGELLEDISAGEQVGEIHNLAVNAHVGGDGVYLSEKGAWYPSPVHADEKVGRLAHYTLYVDRLEGLTFVAGAEPHEDAGPDGRYLCWKSPFPLSGLAMMGAPHVIKTARHGDTLIEARLAPDHAGFADGLLQAAGQYLDIYEPLIGEYPYSRFIIAENFFSSGFAFPTFTLLGPAVIPMGPMGLRPGYLDHEMLHNWWGNGVFVDPADGNWCEALTSYCANYYRYVAEGDEAAARKHRRDICNNLSRIKPLEDKPLGDYGKPDGPSRGIAYSKGAMVFHMLARQIGQEAFWQAVRKMRNEHLGDFVNWDDMRDLFEEVSGKDLDWFFKQWVRHGAAPTLAVTNARYDSDTETLTLAVTQGDEPFRVHVPLRLHFGLRSEERVVELADTPQTVTIELAERPDFLELDPDYHVFRKLPADQMMPTIGFVARGKSLRVLTPPGEPCEAFKFLTDKFLEKADDKGKAASVEDIDPAELRKHNLLILGSAARNDAVRELLTRAACPITFTDDGFAVAGRTYAEPTDEVVCTMHHPDISGGLICVYYGNDEEKLAKFKYLTFYGGNSLIVFEDGRPNYREDFESVPRIEVTRVGR